MLGGSQAGRDTGSEGRRGGEREVKRVKEGRRERRRQAGTSTKVRKRQRVPSSEY